MRKFLKPFAILVRFLRSPKRLWAALDHFGRILLLIQFGVAAVLTAVVGSVVYVLDFMPAPFLALLTLGAFLLAFGSATLAVPHIVNRLPAPPARKEHAPKTARPWLPAGAEASMSATAQQRERVLRGNVQILLDELDAARRQFADAIEEDRYWPSPVNRTMWANIQKSLLGEPGFHVAYAATRDAYEAVERCEKRRAWDLEAGDVVPGEEILRSALREIGRADRMLTTFLSERDGR